MQSPSHESEQGAIRFMQDTAHTPADTLTGLGLTLAASETSLPEQVQPTTPRLRALLRFEDEYASESDASETNAAPPKTVHLARVIEGAMPSPMLPSGIGKLQQPIQALESNPASPGRRKKGYKYKQYDNDPRDWIMTPTNQPQEVPFFPGKVKYTSSSSDLPRVASSGTVSLFRLGNENLEGTAGALGIEKPETVPKFMYDKGISPWAAVKAVGGGMKAGVVPGADTHVGETDAETIHRFKAVSEPAGSIRQFSLMERRRGKAPQDVKLPSFETEFAVDDEQSVKRNFIIKLARTFFQYGAPSHRLEFHLNKVSKVLDVEADFFLLPNLILISFGGENFRSSTHLVKTHGGNNMAKLAQVNALCLTLTEGLIDIQNASDLLEGVRAAADFPWWMIWLSYPVQAFTFALLVFNTGWYEALVATGLGFMAGGMDAMGGKFSAMSYMMEFFSSIIATFVARALQGVFYKNGLCFDYVKVTLAAIVPFLPGMSLTISIIELSTRNVVSGTVRMFAALFVAMLIGFGMTIGGSLVLWDTSLVRDTCAPVSSLWNIVFFLPMAMAINIYFNGSKHQWPIMTLASALGFVTSLLLNMVPILQAQPTAVNAIASTVIGLTSNIYARVTNEVAVAPILVSLWVQVPGSISVKSMLGFFVSSNSGVNSTAGVGSASGIVDGSNFVFQMLNIAMSLAMGLFVATMLVWPIRGPKYENLTI